MSPMIDRSQRYQATYRIRIGDQEGPLDRNGKPTPQALTDRIRVTAPTPLAPQAFADTFGSVDNEGVTEWANERTADRFQVYLPVAGLRVWVLPGNTLEQWWEFYKGKVCERRCNGVAQTTGERCVCPVPREKRMEDRKACKPMSRLSVIAADVLEQQELRAVGDMVTHSLIAADVLPGAFAIAAPHLNKGIPVEAMLYVHTHRGRTNFSFPVLEIVRPIPGVVMNIESPGIGSPQRAGQVERGVVLTPALEAGEAQTEVPPASAAPPPTPAGRAPFTEEDATLIGPMGARELRGLCAEAGLRGEDLIEIVMTASRGRTDQPKMLYKSEQEEAERLVGVAANARPEPVETGA